MLLASSCAWGKCGFPITPTPLGPRGGGRGGEGSLAPLGAIIFLLLPALSPIFPLPSALLSLKSAWEKRSLAVN